MKGLLRNLARLTARLAPSAAAACLGACLGVAIAATPGFAAVSVYVSPEELAEQAPLVVEGTVVRSAAAFDPESARLATYVTLRVETTHRGPRMLEELVLREPGGEVAGLAHELDAVPVYRAGERVLVFVEPTADGALRTSSLFFGKFTVDEDDRGRRWARRDLDGQGLILRRPAAASERLPLGDLVATVTTLPRRAERGAAATRRPRPSRATFAGTRRMAPPEYDRLIWADTDETGRPLARFVTMSSAQPARWFEADTGTAVEIDIDPSSNPLGDAAAAVAEIQRAMQAWTDVPEARLTLVPGDTAYDYSAHHAASPAASYIGRNVVLFDDPYGDITDPSGCAGVLAIGGYWRSTALGGSVNGVAFHRAVQLYTIFNNGFDCILADADNLAEVATHELGHGIGFGHSTVFDAIMRSTAYLDRGPRLGDDDRDAAHCHYPHTFSVLAPSSDETWQVGTLQQVRWSATPEDGSETGVVSLEYSTDGGQSWKPLAESVANDGVHDWWIPNEPGAQTRVRVLRRNRTGFTPPPFPDACSSAVSKGTFSIVAPPPAAGAIPDGTNGSTGLRLERAPGGMLRLSWEPSCSADATNYAVYEGTLAALRAGSWDHLPLSCGSGGALETEVTPGAGNRFYLVAPLAGTVEGGLGRGTGGAARPASTAACAERETQTVCD